MMRLSCLARLKSISCLPILLALLATPSAQAQTSIAALEPGAAGSDALPYLTELFARYAHATSYHVEFIAEHG